MKTDERDAKFREIAERHMTVQATKIAGQEWVSVEERLPVVGTWVLVWKPFRECCQIIEYSHRSEDHRLNTRRDGQWWDSGSQVTHWMPLPAPPAEKGRE